MKRLSQFKYFCSFGLKHLDALYDLVDKLFTRKLKTGNKLFTRKHYITSSSLKIENKAKNSLNLIKLTWKSLRM